MSASMSPEWRAQLTEAFEVLLQRPLDSYDPDATYAVYAWGNFVQEVGLDRLPGLIKPDVLSGARIFVNDGLTINDTHPSLRVDVSRSLFSTLPDVDDTVEGRELAAPPTGDWSVHAFCLASDGTLFDAMRAATGVGDSPADLVEYEYDADKSWDTALADAGVDPALRAHLAWCCSDGLAGLTWSGADEEASVPKGTVVGFWEDQHGQWEMALVKL